MKELLPDELWTEIEPLLPVRDPQPKGGRPWAQDRDCLRGILFILRTGIPGRCCPRKPSESAAPPAGGGSRRGPNRASGRSCTSAC